MVAIPPAYSYYCKVQIDKVDFPSSVSPSQSFQVTTHVTASCPVQLSVSTSVRVDVVDAASNMVLSTGLFATGYSFAHGAASVDGVVASNLTAPPSLSGLWSLVVEALFYQQLDLMSAAQHQFAIQVGTPQPSESLMTVQILQNGGFENGTADWQSTQGSAGYDSIATSVVYSGSRALAITLMGPPPGSNLGAPVVVGVSQTSSVSNLRGLTIDAWYVTQILSTQAAARVRVTVHGHTLNYYVKFGALTREASANTEASKSLFLANWNCVSWCEVSRDVGADFRTMFSPATVSSIFGSGASTATIALELLGYGEEPFQTSQFIFWDDVQFNAQVVATNSVSTRVAEPTSTSTSTTSSEVTTSANLETGSSQATTQGFSVSTGQLAVGNQAQTGTIGLLGSISAVILVAVVASVLVMKKRRRSATASTVILEPKPAGAETRPPQPSQPSLSTGYSELDSMLGGGVPLGYAVVLVSQSYDERDLLIRKIIDSSVAAGMPTVYMSDDIAKTRDLIGRHKQNFYALNAMADKIAPESTNLFKIPDVGDLSNLNITSNKIIELMVADGKSKVLIIDFLSDLLIRNKALTTRKWLSDFAAKRKAGGFTVLATLDPSIAQKEDIQTIVGVFDGVLEVYEKPLQERARRFLVIKKMYARDYSENELMLDKQRLL
jgi:KaiC/GvpD/RAD55 family RecA-like ATPase